MTFTDSLQSLALTSPLAVATVATFTVLAILLLLLNRPSIPSNAPPYSHLSYPIVGALKFWTAPWDLFSESAAKSRSGNFSFHIGKWPVVGLIGNEGRKLYLESKQLDMSEGYAILFAQAPNATIDVDDPSLKKGFMSYFHKRLMHLLRAENLAPRLKPLTTDIRASLEQIRIQARFGKDIINPYDRLYDVVFQLTLRLVGCNEIADDWKKLHQLLSYYKMLDESSTNPLMVIYPWLPTLAMLKRSYAGIRMYMMFKGVVDQRKKQGRTEDDGLQHLLDCGDSVTNVVTFVAGALFAGVINSSINAGAVLAFLAYQPEWQDKVRKELYEVVETYASPESKGRPVEERLTTLPLEVWETKFPSVDLCLKESIRLNLWGCGYRRNNTNTPVEIPGSKGEIIPAGQFAAYHFADAHLNPNIFSHPQKFDPARYLPGREEDKKQPYAFMGWGAGRHPCLGMRFAKLEQNLIMAFLVAMFDWELCTEQGEPEPRGLPEIDLKSRSGGKPEKSGLPKRSVYVKCNLREKA